MALPVLTSKDLRTLKLIFQKTSQELSSAAGYHNHNPFNNWENGIGAPTINEYFEMTAYCGLTPSESFDWLTATQKDEALMVFYKLTRNRKLVVLLDEECC